MTAWTLIYEGFIPEQEGLREALCTLGNGYFATRGAAPEATADGIHYPGTYLAGGYNRLWSEVAGRKIENEDLVNLPNWLSLTFRIQGGAPFHPGKTNLLSYCQTLDMRQGVLHRTLRFEDGEGRRTRLATRSIVHLADPHLAALETSLTPENWSGKIVFRSGLDGRIVNAGVERYGNLAGRHLEPLESASLGESIVFLRVRTRQSRLEVVQAARTEIFQEGEPVQSSPSLIGEAGFIGQDVEVAVTAGRTVTLEKTVALFTSRDPAISECCAEAEKTLRRAGRFDALTASHAVAWKHLWNDFDVAIELRNHEDSIETERILHLHILHLLQTVSPAAMDLDCGVPARGWHGEAYRGHIFWDELFVFPLLNLRVPEITRALLKYRYRRLDEARHAAREAGHRGAMYPWQSGSDGREESQSVHLNPESGRWIPDNTRLQRHVSAAIVYNVWQYAQVTMDLEFMAFCGAEMVLEIARFWASISSYNPGLDRYEILGVMGPDEYHDSYPDSREPGLRNNAYTNLMAVWVLCRALEVLDLLPGNRRIELCETLDLRREELALWDEISRKMRICFHEDGIISQFEGYERLAELDWERYRKRYGKVMRLDRVLEAEGDSPNRYKASKQADVLMLFYLFSAEELGSLFRRLGYPFEYDTIPKNVDYYIKRTSHGSTLSQMVHSWVLARSDRRRSWELFTRALRSDVADIQGGTTPEGIHLGAMAGTVDLMERGYSGVETRGDTLWFNPSLPEELVRLRMRIRYRRHSLGVEISRDSLKVSALICDIEPIRIGHRDRTFLLAGGETVEIRL